MAADLGRLVCSEDSGRCQGFFGAALRMLLTGREVGECDWLARRGGILGGSGAVYRRLGNRRDPRKTVTTSTVCVRSR